MGDGEPGDEGEEGSADIGLGMAYLLIGYSVCLCVFPRVIVCVGNIPFGWVGVIACAGV